MNVAQALTLLALAQCLLLALAALIYGGYKTIANRLMAFILLAEAARLSAIYLFIAYEGQPPAGIEFLMLTRIMLAPTLYLYTTAITRPNFQLLPRHWLHAVPWLLSNLIVIWNYNAGRPIERMDMTMIQATITASTFIAYGGLSLYRLRSYHTMTENLYADPGVHKLTWLRVAHFYLLIIGAGYLFTELMYVTGLALLTQPQLLLVSVLTTTGFVYLVSLLGIQYFRVLERAGDRTAADENFALKLVPVHDDAKYSSGLTAQEVEQFLGILEGVMEEEKPYLQHRLKLADVGDATGLHPQQVSQVINQGTGMNFHDYINGYRVRHALELIARDPGAIEHINDLYEDCGFNSQSTFYKHFRKVTGTTPRQYRQAA